MKRVFILFTAAGLLLNSCGESEPEPIEHAAMPVRTVAVQKRMLSRPVVTSGLLEAEQEIKLSFKISGFVDSV